MGYEDRGETKVGTKFTQRCAHVLSQVDVKARKRFIEQQQRRPMYQRPRESRALLLAPGQLVRIAIAEAVNVDEPQHLVDPSLMFNSAYRWRGGPQHERETLRDCHVWPEGQILEDKANTSLVRRYENRPSLRRVSTSDPHVPGVGSLEARNNPQQCRLADSTWADKSHRISGRHIQRHVLKQEAPALCFVDALEAQGTSHSGVKTRPDTGLPPIARTRQRVSEPARGRPPVLSEYWRSTSRRARDRAWVRRAPPARWR